MGEKIRDFVGLAFGSARQSSKAHGFCLYPRINICAFADMKYFLTSSTLNPDISGLETGVYVDG